MLVFLGIGHLIHAIYPVEQPVKYLWIGLLSCGSIFMVMAAVFEIQALTNIWVLAVLMCLNGYMQSYSWPMLLMIVHSQFDPKKYSSLLGFWSTNANFGNIMGYGLCKLVFNANGLNFKWNYVLAVSAFYTVLNGSLVFFRFK